MNAIADVADSVRTAIAELERVFSVNASPTGDGGAVVTVHGLDVGERWRPSLIELTFDIPYNYPHAPIYPYYTEPELERADSGTWPPALQRVAWRGAQRTQISLRATRWNPAVDTAVGAVLQVQRWFETVA